MPKHVSIPAPSIDHDFEAQEDQRTLVRAAEIMADRVRVRGVVRAQKRSRLAMGKLETLLASRRLKARRAS